jgi:hypothetical protein
MNPADPSLTTPKRKRSLPPTAVRKESSSILTANLTSTTSPEEDGISGSPRTRVAYRFQGLDLEGAAITKLDLKSSSQAGSAIEEEDPLRKRPKILEGEGVEIPETPQGLEASFGSDGDGQLLQKFQGSLLRNDEPGPVVFKGLGDHIKRSSSKLARSYPSINRLADSKSRGRKRLSSPPLSSTVDASLLDIEDMVVDPDRAALTWHDDEITGHDPSDPEDDGEGINGIGFKPTPAEARARAERRRQQMAEYKSREMKEARAKRSERRRGGASMMAGSKDQEAARRVRFSEAEANIMITTL